MKKLFAACALLALASLPAQAVTFQNAVTTGATAVTDYSGSDLISFDIDLYNLAPVTLNYAIDTDDTGAPITFSSFVRNFTGAGLDELVFTLSLSRFDSVGSVTTFNGNAVVALNGEGNVATIQFPGTEYLDILVGNPTMEPGRIDWSIDASVLRSGDQLSITAAVPEPQTYALLLAGLGLAFAAARRRG
jgi:hypothetical protein